MARGDMIKLLNPRNVVFQYSTFLLIFMFISLADLVTQEPDRDTQLTYLLNLALVFGLSEIYYQIYTNILKLKGLNYLNLGITAAIVFLLIHPTSPWWFFPLAMGVTLVAKHILRRKTGPIANPAAAGLVLAYLVTVLLQKIGFAPETLFVSWWGTDLQFGFVQDNSLFAIVPVLLFSGMLYFAAKIKKLLYGSMYFLVYVAATLIYTFYYGGEVESIAGFLYGILTSSFVFLAYVMVIEPKTSPVSYYGKLVFGTIGGFVLFFFTTVYPKLPGWPLIEIPAVLSIVIINLLVYFSKKYRWLM